MAVEQFTKAEFEAALDEIFKSQGRTWVCDGFRAGELRYHVLLRKGASLEINSSIGKSGIADGTGDNSIRVWLADEDGKPLAKKEQAYVTRVKGWQNRLAAVAKATIDKAEEMLESPACPKCGGVMVKRSRKSDGNQFWGCKRFPNCTGTRNIEATTSRPAAPQVRTAGLPVEVAKDLKWKQEFARREADQERIAFMSDPDMMRIHEQVVSDVTRNAEIITNAVELMAPKKFVPSKYQQAIFEWTQSTNVHVPGVMRCLVVEALAGSGKTSTGVENLKLLPTNEEVAFIAFNRHIVAELEKRAPKNVTVRSYNQLGFAAVRAAFGNVQVDKYKVQHILETLLDKYVYRALFSPIKQLVGLVKANLSGTSDEELNEICDHHTIELNGSGELIFNVVRQTIHLCKTMTSVIDLEDQCWLPVVLNLPMKKYNTIVVDEAQDTNKMQIALALMSVTADGRIMAFGDRFQSLYGFRGADVDAIPNLIKNLNAEVLPLSITYRNPKCVVRLVNDTFPQIPLEAAEWAKEGSIINLSGDKALAEYRPGDMVLCRTNAPLVEPAFALIRRGIKAIIRGRDIGDGLLVLVRKMKAYDLPDLLVKLTEYKNAEISKLLMAEKNSQAQALEDKVDTIVALSDGVTTITQVEDRIDGIFSDDVEGVTFSSVHRAKGLEAERVFILHPELMPHPMAKKDWEQVQERNIKYVAYTRTLDTLVFVD